MTTRNPEEKRRRLIAAGIEEFSERGLSGARLDRIAKRAGCSAGLLYSYFANKEALFDAAFADIIGQILEEVPITGDDLPGYAARLWAAEAAHPVEARFLSWYELERTGGRSIPEHAAADADKVAAVKAAQHDGVVDDTVEAGRLLGLVVAIAHGYDGPESDGADVVRDAVARLVAPRRDGD